MSLLQVRYIDNRAKELAASDLTVPTKTVVDLATARLSDQQRSRPRVKKIDFRQRVYRHRFKGMKLSWINRVPFKEVIVPNELAHTLDGRPFLVLDTKQTHPGRIDSPLLLPCNLLIANRV